MGNIDQAIVDHAAGILLRYFRSGSQASSLNPLIQIERDREILRSHWALSDAVLNLVAYLIRHRHETHALLSTQRRIEDAVARGRIDVRATIQHRIRSGLRSALVVEEAVRTFETGPNQVLAWVLHHAAMWACRFEESSVVGVSYATIASQVVRDVDGIRRFEALRDVLRSPTISRRPSPGALRNAARSRRPVYRLAVDAYGILQGVEDGLAEAIRTVVGSTLIGPLETWRRLELAVALAIGEALSNETGVPLAVNAIASDGMPAVVCGRFAVCWQQLTRFYSPPALEASEVRTKTVLEAYGIAQGTDRPDLLVLDTMAGRVAAVVEVKYLTGDTAAARFREAVDQITRYSRGYAAGPALEDLIGCSLVVMSEGVPELQKPGVGIPAALDFEAITQGQLQPWVRKLVR